jgi:hypothetical protein
MVAMIRRLYCGQYERVVVIDRALDIVVWTGKRGRNGIPDIQWGRDYEYEEHKVHLTLAQQRGDQPQPTRNHLRRVK